MMQPFTRLLICAGFLSLMVVNPGFSGEIGAKNATRLKKQPTSIQSALNNDCIGATPLQFNVPVTDNNTGATQSQPPNPCNFFTPPAAKDVWFSFTYTSQMDSLVVSPPGNPDMDIAIELFSGACGALTLIGCSNSAEPNSNIQTEGIFLGALGMTVGSNYKLRVYAVPDIPVSFTVLLKSGTGILPPTNDACTTAITMLSGASLIATNLGATESIPSITCNGITGSLARDVWYRFTKAAANDTLLVQPLGTTNMVLEIRTNNCTTGTSVLCSDSRGIGGREAISLSTLTNGTTYLIRVYGINGTAGDFNIRLKNGIANNECGGALEILPNTIRQGSTQDATQSLPPSPVCQGSADDDVWFTFQMVAGCDSVIIESGGSFNAVAELRSGTCANSTAISCSNATGVFGREKLFVGNLTPGQNYFVRVYSFGAGVVNFGTFSVLLRQQNQGPANDGCSTPILISGSDPVSGDNNNATQTLPSEPCGGAGSTLNRDVWYRFVKTEAMDTLLMDGLGTLDLLADVRTNSCPNGTVLACWDKPGTESKKMPLDELVNGQTYLLRVYGRNGATGDFLLQFLDEVVVLNPPVNDECTDAISLIPGQACSPIQGTNRDANESLAGGCSGPNAGQAPDVWYSFTANSNRAIVKLICGLGFDGAIQAYSGNCFSPVSIGCTDLFGPTPEVGFEAEEELFLSGLTSGQTYYIRVYGYNGSQGDFSICVFNPNCNSLVPTLASAATNVLSNQAFTVQMGNIGNGTPVYQYSADQSAWSVYPSLTGNLDTLIFTSTTTGPLYIRVSNREGVCYPSLSETLSLTLRCATPFNLQTVNARINRIQFNTINQVSTRNPLGGNVEDYSAVSTPVCRGNAYNLTFTANQANTACNRMAWIDFNQDGDFNDAGENVVFGPYVAGASLSYPVTIPQTAALGSSRMRVALISNGAAVTSSDPCAAGPYNAGEIEEYTIVVGQGLLAAAGVDQSVCGTQATLAGNNPGVGGSGTWTVVSGTGVFANAGVFNTTVTGLSSGQNRFRWAISNSCGTSADTVVVNSATLVANAGTDLTVCTTATNLNAQAVTGGTGSWTVLSGGATVATAGSPTSGVSNLATGPNSFIWVVTPSAPGCPTSRDTVVIIRKAAPVPNAGTNQALCGSTASLGATAPSSGLGRWRRISGSGILADSTLATSGVSGLGFGANVFRWTVTDAPCAPVFAEVTLTNNLPAKPSAGTDQLLCGPSNATVSAGAIPPGLSGTWAILSGSAQLATPTQASTGISNLGSGQNLITFTLAVPACSTSLSDTVRITRETNPVNLGIDSIICQNFNPTYTLVGPAGMSNYLWTGGSTSSSLVTSATGSYVLSVQTPAGCTFGDTIQLTFEICGSVAGLKPGFANAGIRPNPAQANSASWLHVGTQPESKTSLQIFDVRGVRIWSSGIEKTETLLPQNLIPGLYQVQIQDSKQYRSLRWVVQ